MSPLLQNALTSSIRLALAGVAGWLVQRGAWTPDAADQYLTAAALAIVTVGWSLWSRYKSRIKFLTALEMPPGTPEEVVDAKLKQGLGAKLLALAVAVALLGGASAGCAGTIRDQVRTSALMVGETALRIDQVERDIARAVPPIYTSPAQQRQVSEGVLTMLTAARAYERAVRAWPAGVIAMPRDVWEAQTAAIAAIIQVEGVVAGLPGASSLVASLKTLRELMGG